jgi:hypothetical protein
LVFFKNWLLTDKLRKKPAGSIKKVAAPKIKPNVTASSLVSQKPQATTKPATGYWLVKLPIEDPRAPILGHVTNCCQSIGGHSEKCVIDGMKRESNGFYVLLHNKEDKKDNKPIKDDKIDYNNYEIVGQGYAWLSEENNLVFDSWENLRPEKDDQIAIKMLEAFAAQVAEDKKLGISRVMIGKGGKTPKGFKDQIKETYADTMKEGNQYGDSLKQAVVYESGSLIEGRKKIQKYLLGNELNVDERLLNRFISSTQIDTFLSFVGKGNNLELIKQMIESSQQLGLYNN